MLSEGEFILPQDTMPPGRAAVKSIFFIEKAKGGIGGGSLKNRRRIQRGKAPTESA